MTRAKGRRRGKTMPTVEMVRPGPGTGDAVRAWLLSPTPAINLNNNNGKR